MLYTTTAIAPPINPATPPTITMMTSPTRPAPIPSAWEPQTDPIPPNPAARRIPATKLHTNLKTANNFPMRTMPYCFYCIPCYCHDRIYLSGEYDREYYPRHINNSDSLVRTNRNMLSIKTTSPSAISFSAKGSSLQNITNPQKTSLLFSKNRRLNPVWLDSG